MTRRNYNLLHNELQEDWYKIRGKLNHYSDLNDLLQQIGTLKFNQRFLSNFTEEIIEQFYSRERGENFQWDEKENPEEQTHMYQVNALSSGEFLLRYRDDFKCLLTDIYKDLKDSCEKQDINKLQSLLGEYPWACDMLSDYDSELGIITAKNGAHGILHILFEKSYEIQNYKQTILIVAAENKQYESVKSLIQQWNADPIQLLNKGTYYSDSEIVRICTSFLLDQPDEQSKQYGKYFQAMSLYSCDNYNKAIEIFSEVNYQGLKIKSLYYKGLCLQYTNQIQEALDCFGSIKEYEPLDDSFKQSIAQHIVQLNSQKDWSSFIKYKQKLAADWIESNRDNLQEDKLLSKFFEDIIGSVQKIHDNLDNRQEVTEKYKQSKNCLAQIKYVSLKVDVPKNIVLAHEFRDIPEFLNQFIDEKESITLKDYELASSTNR